MTACSGHVARMYVLGQGHRRPRASIYDVSKRHSMPWLTYCDRSSINVCKLLFNTQDNLRSTQRLHGGPVFSSMMHLICVSSVIVDGNHVSLWPLLTFCFRHAAQAFTLREIAGVVASANGSDCRGREAAGDIEVPPFSVTCDQVRLGGISQINNTRDKSAVFSLQWRFAKSNLEMVRDRVWSWCGDLPAIYRNMASGWSVQTRQTSA